MLVSKDYRPSAPGSPTPSNYDKEIDEIETQIQHHERSLADEVMCVSKFGRSHFFTELYLAW